MSERIRCAELGTLYGFRGKGVNHVAHDGVADAVTDEDHGKFAKQFRDEPGSPSFGQIRSTEIRCREDEIRAVLIRKNTAMQMHDA